MGGASSLGLVWCLGGLSSFQGQSLHMYGKASVHISEVHNQTFNYGCVPHMAIHRVPCSRFYPSLIV